MDVLRLLPKNQYSLYIQPVGTLPGTQSDVSKKLPNPFGAPFDLRHSQPKSKFAHSHISSHRGDTGQLLSEGLQPLIQDEAYYTRALATLHSLRRRYTSLVVEIVDLYGKLVLAAKEGQPAIQIKPLLGEFKSKRHLLSSSLNKDLEGFTNEGLGPRDPAWDVVIGFRGAFNNSAPASLDYCFNLPASQLQSMMPRLERGLQNLKTAQLELDSLPSNPENLHTFLVTDRAAAEYGKRIYLDRRA